MKEARGHQSMLADHVAERRRDVQNILKPQCGVGARAGLVLLSAHRQGDEADALHGPLRSRVVEALERHVFVKPLATLLGLARSMLALFLPPLLQTRTHWTFEEHEIQSGQSPVDAPDVMAVNNRSEEFTVLPIEGRDKVVLRPKRRAKTRDAEARDLGK